MRDLYYGHNANPKSTNTFDYGQNDVECLLGYFLKEDDITQDENMKRRDVELNAQHDDILMTPVEIIGHGTLFIPVEPWMHESKRKPPSFNQDGTHYSTQRQADIKYGQGFYYDESTPINSIFESIRKRYKV